VQAAPPPEPTGSPRPGPASAADEAAWAALRELGSIDLDTVEVSGRRTAGDRPALLEVDRSDEAQVTVVLRHRGQRVEGVQRAGPELRDVERAAARATIEAVLALLPPRVAELHLDWFDVLAPPTPSRDSVVHVAVAVRTATGEDVLVGSALVRDDAGWAAARAVLDAVNRRFTDLSG
jgi:hypothetical protein